MSSQVWLIPAVATSRLVLRWMRGSPQTGYAQRTTPMYMWRERAIIEWSWRSISGDANDVTCERLNVTTSIPWHVRVIMACELYCCLLPQCEAVRTCRGISGRNASNGHRMKCWLIKINKQGEKRNLLHTVVKALFSVTCHGVELYSVKMSASLLLKSTD